MLHLSMKGSSDILVRTPLAGVTASPTVDSTGVPGENESGGGDSVDDVGMPSAAWSLFIHPSVRRNRCHLARGSYGPSLAAGTL